MDKEALISELTFKAIRSSGAGGQNVNKVATKVELYFDLENSLQFSEEEKKRLNQNLVNRINSEGVLMLSCGESRSQWRNKKLVIKRLFEVLEEGLKEQKQRVPTKVPRRAKRKRLKNKRIRSEKKTNRKPPDLT